MNLQIKENFEGGATWAFEVGSQSMICPIVVEDLNHPRQMLVEVGILMVVSKVGLEPIYLSCSIYVTALYLCSVTDAL